MNGAAMRFCAAIVGGMALAAGLAPAQGASSGELILHVFGPDGEPNAYAQAGRSIDWSYPEEPTVFSLSSSFAPYSDQEGVMRIAPEQLFLESERAGIKLRAIVIGGNLETAAWLDLTRADFGGGEPRALKLGPAIEVRGSFAISSPNGEAVPPDSGFVTLNVGETMVASCDVRDDLSFMLRVPPGSYTLSASCMAGGTALTPIDETLTLESGSDPVVVDFAFTAESEETAAMPSGIGWPLPELTAVKQWRHDEIFSPSAARSKATVVLFWNDLSAEGMEALEELVAIHRSQGLLGARFAAVYTGADHGEIEAALTEFEATRLNGRALRIPVGWDTPSEMAKAFNVTTLPGVVVADSDGEVTAIGAPDGVEVTKSIQVATLALGEDTLALPPLPAPMAGAAPAGGGEAAASTPSWWDGFTTRYQLDHGETVKYIYPPFLAARREYFSAQAPDVPEPNFMILDDDARTVNAWPLRSYAYSNRLTLRMLLEYGLGLRAWEIEGPEALFDVDVMGDWILKGEAEMDAQLSGVAVVLRNIFSYDVTVARGEAPRPVLVVQGKEEKAVAVQDAAEEEKLKRLCRQLEILLQMPVVNEVRFSYGSPPGATLGIPDHFDVSPDLESAEGLEAFLHALESQSVLDFVRMERPVPVWEFEVRQ